MTIVNPELKSILFVEDTKSLLTNLTTRTQQRRLMVNRSVANHDRRMLHKCRPIDAVAQLTR